MIWGTLMRFILFCIVVFALAKFIRRKRACLPRGCSACGRCPRPHNRKTVMNESEDVEAPVFDIEVKNEK